MMCDLKPHPLSLSLQRGTVQQNILNLQLFQFFFRATVKNKKHFFIITSV